MKTSRLPRKWRQRPLLFRFLATLYFLALIPSVQVFSQTLTCDKTQCTSNDVRVISGYISGPDNAPIDCGSTDPFNDAELHLIVSSNTKRIGASIVGKLNILNTTTGFDLAHCFSNITINNGSQNNLVYELGSSLSGVLCPASFSLTDLFISWGTGNTNFCTSESAQCPATPAKCRFKAGETIPVTVKLDVDFSFDPGVCNLNGNSLAVNFLPIITATGLVSPITYTWDFGDLSPVNTGSVNSISDITGVSHTYASAGTYTATLTITDNNSTAVTKTAIHAFELTSCCNLTAPDLAVGPFCSADGKKIGDLPQTDGNGGTYHWYNASDPDNSYELDPTTIIPLGNNIYYVTVASGDCESPRVAVTVTVNQTPTAPTVTSPICAGATIVSGGNESGAAIEVFINNVSVGLATVNGTTWSKTASAVSANDVITAKATSASNCISDASAAVTVRDNATTPTVTSPICAGATIVSGGNESGAAIEVFINNVSVGLATVNGTTWSKTVSAVSANDVVTAIASVTGKCASGTSSGVTVSPLPPCTITSTGSPTSAVLGTQVVFNGPSGSNYSYSWSFTSNTSGASFVGSHGTGDASVTVTTSTVGSYTLSLTVTNTTTGCSRAGCTYSMNISAAGPYYTVTQGFYGNVGGKVCMVGVYYTAGSKNSVPGLIESSISNMPYQKLVLGSVTNNKSFTMGNGATEANNLIKYMPGNKTPDKLGGNYNITSSLPPLNKGKIANVLLTQSITLALNISITNNTLGGFGLKTNYLTTQKADPSACPSTKVLACTSTNNAISSVKITTNVGLINWINGGSRTVQDLLNLASAVLGGATPPTGATLTDINNAIDVINNAFDGGRFFLGYFDAPKSCSSNLSRTGFTNTKESTVSVVEKKTEVVETLSVHAYPNPFTNKVQFSILSPVSGMASLDVYNIVGQKLHTVYNGYLFAGTKQVVDYNVPSSFKGALIYTLKVGDQHVDGKVLQVK